MTNTDKSNEAPLRINVVDKQGVPIVLDDPSPEQNAEIEALGLSMAQFRARLAFCENVIGRSKDEEGRPVKQTAPATPQDVVDMFRAIVKAADKDAGSGRRLGTLPRARILTGRRWPLAYAVFLRLRDATGKTVVVRRRA